MINTYLKLSHDHKSNYLKWVLRIIYVHILYTPFVMNKNTVRCVVKKYHLLLMMFLCIFNYVENREMVSPKCAYFFLF